MGTGRSWRRSLAALFVVGGSLGALVTGAVRGALAVDDAEQCSDIFSVYEGSIWTTRSRVDQHEAMIAKPPPDAGAYLGWESTRSDDPREYIDWMQGYQRRVDECGSIIAKWEDTSASELAQMRAEVRVLSECINAWSAVQPGAWPHSSTQCRPCSEGSVVTQSDELRAQADRPDSSRWCVSRLDS